MKAEMPAVGILKRNDWGDAKSYEIACSCCDPEHSHNLWVEANEDGEIVAIIYTTTTSPFWSANRWRQMWQLLTRGYITSEVALSMNEQQALNYAETLKKSIKDIKTLRAEKNGDS